MSKIFGWAGVVVLLFVLLTHAVNKEIDAALDWKECGYPCFPMDPPRRIK